MSKNLFLLAGLHKTGTTSIQKTCFANRELLSRKGFVYPVVRSTHLGKPFIETNHSKMLQFLFRETLSEHRATGNYKSLFDRLLESANQNLILIAEGISKLTPAELDQMNSYFSSKGYKLKVFCCIRPVGQWIHSTVSQKICGLRGPRWTLDFNIQQFTSSGNIIKSEVERYRKVFENIRFYCFNDAAGHPNGPAGYFFHLLGLDLHDGFIWKLANASLGDNMVRLHHEFNKLIGQRYASAENDRYYTKLPEKYPALYTKIGRKFSLRTSEIENILPLIHAENQWLKKEFGRGFYEEEIIFCDQLVALSDEERRFLVDISPNTEQPLRDIIERYLAEH